MDLTKTWYAARLIIASSIVEGSPDDDSLLEERIVLFQADSVEAASAAAIRYGAGETQEYKNGAGETVRWHLEEVQDLSVVDSEPVDGSWEVLSRFLRRSELPVIKED